MIYYITYNEADRNSSRTVYKLPNSDESKIGKANTTQAHKIKLDKLKKVTLLF